MEDRNMPIFVFVAPDKFTRPTEPKAEAARSGLRALWKRFQRSRHTSESIDIQAELHSVSQQLLDWVAPSPTWEDTKDALNAALKTWHEDERTEQNIQVIVGPPGSGIRQTLLSWAEEHRCGVIKPPTPEETLSGGGEWIQKLQRTKEKAVVFPAMEACYLRHHNGLKLIRGILEYMKDGNRRWLIGCNSWAWSYLSKAVKIDSLMPVPHVLQALDGVHLQQWFQSLIKSTDKGSFIFRQSDNGTLIFSVSGNKDQTVQKGLTEEKIGGVPEQLEAPDFIKKVATRGRGIPLVCWAIWRNSLQVAGETTIDMDALRAAAVDKGLTIWVRPLDKIELPAVPSDISRCDSFILHALLLHAGLSDDVIRLLLPFSPDEIIRGLNSLHNHGLTKYEKGTWRVSLSGYPSVRQHLYNEGYPVDAF